MRKLKLLVLLCILCLLANGCTNEEKVKNKEMSLEYQGKTYKGTYTGILKKGEPSGGTFSYKDGNTYLTYKGGISDGQMSGNGTLKTNLMKTSFSGKDCTGIYDGDFLDGEAWDGSFKFVTPRDLKDSVYKGGWMNNLMDGKGRLDFSKKGWGSFIGHFNEGYFDPSKPDTFTSLGTLLDIKFSVSSNADNFIKKNGNLFMVKNEKKLKNYIDTSADYHNIIKDPDSHGTKLMKFSHFCILDTQLNTGLFGKPISLILLGSPSENQYIYVICIDSVKNVAINSYQTVYGLPIGSSEYETESGTKKNVLIIAGSFLKHE